MSSSNQQQIEQEGSSYFHIVLNMADDDLDPYQYRLLGHYIRVGKCTEGIRKTAKTCQMSVGKAVSTRESLEKLGYISVIHRKTAKGDDDTCLVTIRDRMIENVQRYKKRSPDEGGGVHPVGEGVHLVNQRITIEEEHNINTSSGEQVAAAQVSPDKVEIPSTVKAEEKPTVKHNLNVAEQAVAIYIMHVTDEESWTLKTVIEEIRSTLKPLWESVKRADPKSRTDEDKQKMAASVKSFTEWYKRKHPDLDMVRRDKVSIYYEQFKSEFKKRQATVPAQSEDPNRITADELEAAGGDLDSAINAKRKRLAAQE